MGRASDERRQHHIRRAQGRERYKQRSVDYTEDNPRPTRFERRLEQANVARSSDILKQFDRGSDARKIALQFIDAYITVSNSDDEYAEAELTVRRQLPRHVSADERAIKCGIWAARRAIDAARATLEE